MLTAEKQIRVQINCQKGKTVEAEILKNSGSIEQDGIQINVSESAADGCTLGNLRLKIIRETLSESWNLSMEAPVRVYLPLTERPEKITAMYLYNPWWTRPAFVEKLQDIPEHTQFAFFKYRDRCACFVPMVGRKFKTYLTGGTETGLCLEMTAHIGGEHEIDEPLYLFSEADTVTEAVHRDYSATHPKQEKSTRNGHSRGKTG